MTSNTTNKWVPSMRKYIDTEARYKINSAPRISRFFTACRERPIIGLLFSGIRRCGIKYHCLGAV